jgi:hypothetical protein
VVHQVIGGEKDKDITWDDGFHRLYQITELQLLLVVLSFVVCKLEI